ncbi:MAG: YihA family ribosome biogenesis GTP-binding protein [Ignavibacteria bacterium]|nr:YihA family ribosome biogenesis GTP-binding protein [Ignavibacteria bacterium]
MKIQNAQFLIGSNNVSKIPKYNFSEIAFTGRSNVGKSSLINTIVHRKKLAKVSSTPGKTKQINLFLVDESYILADLPGFGYAAVSKTERQSWKQMIYSFFSEREELKLICCLVDSRHEPLDSDLALIEWLENNNKNYIIILTKVDKISEKQIAQRKEQFENFVQYCKHCIEVLPFSSVSGVGRKELHAIMKREISF